MTPERPGGFRTLAFAKQGVAIRSPKDWPLTTGTGPLLVTANSGEAVIALWRYPRGAQVGARSAPARAALVRELVDQSRARDPGLRVLHTGQSTAGGAPAIELDAIERIGSQLRRVRSIHVFGRGAEFVLEEYAPQSLFAAVNRAVFETVRRSLTPTGPAA